MNTILMIFIGGGFGSVARYGISRYITSNFTTINPVATFISNMLATAVLGIVVLLVSTKITLGMNAKALIIIGFCGGFSTFSTFSFETFELFKTGHYLFASLNVFASILLGVIVLILFSKFS